MSSNVHTKMSKFKLIKHINNNINTNISNNKPCIDRISMIGIKNSVNNRNTTVKLSIPNEHR